MNGNEYQDKAHSFATKGGDTLLYSLLGAIEEVGEICEKTSIDRSTDMTDGIHWKVKQFIGLSKEIGALAKKVRKEWDSFTDEQRASVLKTKGTDGIDKEVGDSAWMLANVAHHLGFKMDDILAQNIAKLDERKRTNTIIGSGETVEERLKNRS